MVSNPSSPSSDRVRGWLGIGLLDQPAPPEAE